MDVPSAVSTVLVEAVTECLNAGKFKEALALPNDNKYADALKNNCADLIPVLLNKIENDTIITWPALQTCCERLLMVVAENAHPDEVLLELLERIDMCKNDGQFIAILQPLQGVLKRLTSKRGRSLEWCLTSIHSYIEKLPVPVDYDFSDTENLLRDCDPNTRRILRIYTELPIFYDFFVKEALNNSFTSKPALRDVLLCFFIDLLGKPLAMLDLSETKIKSQNRIIAESIFQSVCTLQPDSFFFLKYVQEKCHPRIVTRNEDGVFENGPTDIFLLDEKLPKTGVAVFYYLQLGEGLSVKLLPQIYNYIYVSHILLDLASHLLQLDDTLLHDKGLKLANKLIKYLPDNCTGEFLSHSGHAELFKSLCTIAVYCSTERFRKMAVIIIREYYLKFNSEGRYYIIVNLLPSLKHFGIIGYIIMLYKEGLLEAFKKNELKFYRGSKLRTVLNISSRLPQGVETDLVESADQIVSSLNLLRFLCLRDLENITGIWDILPKIEMDYLEPLRQAINLSRAHYEARLLDLNEGKLQEPDMSNINITVDGADLNSIPVENQKMVINSGINALHMIDSLLCRLNECINMNKSKLASG